MAGNIDALWEEFRDHPQLVWSANNTGCEAKADLMAEIADSHGYAVSKIWVQPSDSCSYLLVYLNTAQTETKLWNYHVTIMIRMDGDAIVLDPSLCDAPVSLDIWKKRVSWLSDQCDYSLVFQETPREIFFGPNDMTNTDFRQNALAKRAEILSNAANLDDPTVFAGFLMKRRGLFADDIQKQDRQIFEQLKAFLLNDHFEAWFRAPVRNSALEKTLTSHEYYFGIPTCEIRTRIELSDICAYTDLQRIYWPHIGAAIKILKDHASRIYDGPFSGETMTFRVKWNEFEDFKAQWFSPTSDTLWAEYGLRLDALRKS